MTRKGRSGNTSDYRFGLFAKRFFATLLFLVALVVFGTLGYRLIEGWGFADALYMTVITVTAVGYDEVHPLSPNGRTFTAFLLGGAFTWMGLWFALITSFIVELDLGNVLRRRRIMREIGKLGGHVIVCGGGRTGRQVVQELEALGEPWVVIDNDAKRIEDLMALIPDAYVIDGDATHDQTLIEAGIESASGLVTCLSGDTENLFVCLSARDLNPTLTIVARAYEEETMEKLYRAGASHVVSPNVSGAIRMASVLLRPSVVSFLDVATRSSDGLLRMEQTTVDDTSPLAGKTLQEARVPQETGLIVIALRKGADDDFVFNPIATTRLDPGDDVIVLGRPEQIDLLREYVRG